jgi:hypothetical protein
MRHITLTNEAIVTIANDLKTNDYYKINSLLNDSRIPLTFKENIFFQILKIRNDRTLPHQRYLDNLYQDYRPTVINQFIINKYPLEKVFVNLRVTELYFKFFDSIERNFINISKNQFLITKIAYEPLNFSIDIEINIDTVKNYIDPIDLDVAIIAGGIFSKYKDNNLISNEENKVINYFKSNADTDIYILDNDESLFGKYQIRFQNKFEIFKNPLINYHKNNIDGFSDSNKSSYKNFKSFKIRVTNGLLLNFIFVTNYNSVVLVVDDFDLDICKCFYSFKLNSIYVPITIFKMLHSFHSLCPIEDYSIIDSYIQDLRKYQHELQVYVEYCESIKGDFGNLTRRKFEKHVLAARNRFETLNSPSVMSFCKYLKTRFIRVLKYYYKGYYFTGQKVYFEHNIKFLLNIFCDYIIELNDLFKFDIGLIRTRSRSEICHMKLAKRHKEQVSTTLFFDYLYRYASNI